MTNHTAHHQHSTSYRVKMGTIQYRFLSEHKEWHGDDDNQYSHREGNGGEDMYKNILANPSKGGLAENTP
jgi:hypothetical protein